MPTYPYENCKTGEVVDKVMLYKDHCDLVQGNGGLDFILVDGVKWKRIYGDSATIAHRSGDTWSKNGGFENERGETGSLSRAIHMDQVGEQMALDKSKGVTGVEWKPDGRGLARPHFGSKGARDNWDRAHGFISESSY